MTKIKPTKKKEEKFPWWYVYRGTNNTKKEVYHGVALEPKARQDGSHCIGGTKTLRHWVCGKDDIVWITVSKHKTQEKSSSVSHNYEKTYSKKGYTMIRTAGK